MRTDYGSASLRSQVLGLVLRNSVRRLIVAWTLAPGLPWPYGIVDHAGRLQRVVPGTVFETVTMGERRGRVVRTPDSRTGRHILYFHGGAFLVGGWHLHGSLLSRIAAATGTTVHAVDYRQLPSHPAASSTADGLAAYRHLLDQGIPADDIVFMGDSAGGFLTFTVADSARREGLPAPRAIVALSPLVDVDLDRSPIDPGALGCGVFGPRALEVFAGMVTLRSGPGGAHTPMDCVAPGLPPVMLQVSSAEALYSQVCSLAERLEEIGVPVDLHVWHGLPHVFQAATLIPESDEAIAALSHYVARAFGLRVAVAA